MLREKLDIIYKEPKDDKEQVNLRIELEKQKLQRKKLNI